MPPSPDPTGVCVVRTGHRHREVAISDLGPGSGGSRSDPDVLRFSVTGVTVSSLRHKDKRIRD